MFNIGDIVRVKSNYTYKYNAIDSNSRVEVLELKDGGRLFKGKIVRGTSRYYSDNVMTFTSGNFNVMEAAAMETQVELKDRRVILENGKLVRLTDVTKLDDVLQSLHKADHTKKYVVYKPEFESFVEAPPVQRNPIC